MSIAVHSIYIDAERLVEILRDYICLKKIFRTSEKSMERLVKTGGTFYNKKRRNKNVFVSL
jgi:hypothetical protein